MLRTLTAAAVFGAATAHDDGAGHYIAEIKAVAVLSIVVFALLVLVTHLYFRR